MKITNVYCDACGKQTTEYHVIEDLGPAGDMQFCPECWPTIVETVRHLAAGMMAAQPDDDEPNVTVIDVQDVPIEDQPKRKTVDKAKAQALRDAGWTLQAIADELGCHPGYIGKITQPAKKKDQKPLEWEGNE